MGGAVIKFAGDYSILVQETPAEVEAIVRQALETGIPLLRVTLSNGGKVVINPVQICAIW